ncbi:hypothetical protein GCM10010274_18630 [Streptomyces lavendofoliae]|uniref:Uncharacterized protein n=1 Tax=Streptomyces lavendofoliae TaxID=67314 RepID=A0A918HVK1_9ACTN|nr:hypothetical protein GCM10010274_18630 [Streptomyces lavendofoliae]
MTAGRPVSDRRAALHEREAGKAGDSSDPAGSGRPDFPAPARLTVPAPARLTVPASVRLTVPAPARLTVPASVRRGAVLASASVP